MVNLKAKKHTKFIAAIISVCMIFTAVIPTANVSAYGSFESSCAGPAGLLKWLVCPAVDGLTAVLEGIYEAAKGQLTIPTSMITDSSLDKAWGVSRDIANILFVILFLVVIFSQVTGIGIDNYGIKKILPRLIVCAILINLSFIICELLVDISNIVGGSIDNFMTDLAHDISEGAGVSSVSAGAYGVQIGAILIAPALVGTIGLGFIIALIIALCHGVGASITLFFIAIVRKISIILLIALSPLAFASYLLPNTEKAFKKWADWMKSILVIYPICSILVGGGALAGAVLNAGVVNSGTSNDIEILAAMVAPLLPLWFLPKFLKGSLASMGMLGKAVSDWRNKRGIRRKTRAKKALAAAKNSQMYKSAVNTAKIKALGSKSGQGLSGALAGMAGTKAAEGASKGAQAKAALTRGIGRLGGGALAGMTTKARQEQVALDRQQKEQSLWADTTLSGQFMDKNGKISSTQTEGSRELTKGELHAESMKEISAAQINNAQIKGFEELLANRGRGDSEQELIKSLKACEPQRMVAAFRTLLKQGGEEEALAAMYQYGGSAEILNNPAMQAAIAREMGASGSTIMREFSKYSATNPKASFAQFIKSGALTDQLNGKGATALKGGTKETFSFMANVANGNLEEDSLVKNGSAEERKKAIEETRSALQSINNDVLAGAMSSLTSSDQAGKANKFIESMQLGDDRLRGVVNKISDADTATMFDSSRRTLAGVKDGESAEAATAKVMATFKQFNNMNSNPSAYAGIISQMSKEDREKYIKVRVEGSQTIKVDHQTQTDSGIILDTSGNYGAPRNQNNQPYSLPNQNRPHFDPNAK